jgi:hypothetical protein
VQPSWHGSTSEDARAYMAEFRGDGHQPLGGSRASEPHDRKVASEFFEVAVGGY